MTNRDKAKPQTQPVMPPALARLGRVLAEIAEANPSPSASEAAAGPKQAEKGQK